MQRFIFFICILFYTASLQAQQQSFSDQMLFAEHLAINNLWNDSKIFIKYNENNVLLSQIQKDSLNYFAGKVYYRLEHFDTSALYFSKVSNEAPFHNDAIFYGSSALAEWEKYEESSISFSSLKSDEKFDKSLLKFELSGSYLLSRNINAFDSIQKTSYASDTIYTEETMCLLDIKNKIALSRNRSGLIAACMSAIIPGLGKIYAGKTRQGFSSFLPITMLGIQAYEAYRISGIKSARFILSAGLFSVFYIGNIWGSVLSVSVTRNEYNENINHQILLHMRIPVRKLLR